MQYMTDVLIAVSLMYISFFLIDFFIEPKKIRSYKIILLISAVTLISIGLATAGYCLLESTFMLNAYLYFYVAHFLLMTGAYSFTYGKLRKKEN